MSSEHAIKPLTAFKQNRYPHAISFIHNLKVTINRFLNKEIEINKRHFLIS